MAEKAEETKPGLAISTRRVFTGWQAKAVTALAIFTSLYMVIVLSDILTILFNWNVTNVTHRAVALSLFMVLAFLLIPMRKRDQNRLPWYDIILAILGFSGCAYIFIMWDRELFPRLAEYVTTLDYIFAAICILTIFIAAQRAIGWAIPLIALFFLLHTIFCDYFPGVFHGRGYTWERIIQHMYIWVDGVWGFIAGIMFTMVFMFILFATFLRVTGGDKFFLDLAYSLAGRFRGGPAKVSVIGSGLFGMVSGSSIANVASTGAITIPLMKESGYRPYVAAAIEACSSSAGMLMPPVMGAAAFLMASFTDIPYWSVCVAAFIPSVLYYAAIFFMVDFEAARTGLKGLPKSELPSLWRTLLQGWMFIIPLVVLVYFIAVLQWNPTKAALYSILTMIVVIWVRAAINFIVDFEGARTGQKGLPKNELPSLWRTLPQGWVFIFPVVVLVVSIYVLNWGTIEAAFYSILAMIAVSWFRMDTKIIMGKLLGGLEQGSKGMIEIAVVAGIIGIIIGCIGLTGLGVKLSGMLIDISGGNLFFLLLLTAVTSIILGMGLPVTVCYILLATLVAPALMKMGVPDVAAHLFVLYYGVISNITPPVCGAVFVGAAIAGSPIMKTGFESVRIALVAYIVPFLFVYEPALVAIGPAWEITLAVITALIGIAFFASGVQGYLLRKLKWIERIPLITGAFLMIVPGWETDIIGIALGGLAISLQTWSSILARRKIKAPAGDADKRDKKEE